MSSVNLTRDQNQLNRIAALAGDLGASDVASDAQQFSERLASGRLFVTCLGQFKRGKSTLLNALLGRAVLPTGVAPVTSVVTIVRYGPQATGVVRFVDGRSETIEISTLDEYVSETRNPETRSRLLRSKSLFPVTSWHTDSASSIRLVSGRSPLRAARLRAGSFRMSTRRSWLSGSIRRSLKTKSTWSSRSRRRLAR